MEGICGAKCDQCNLFKSNKCNGCEKSRLRKKCFIADYIEIGGKENFEKFKKQLILEFNNLCIEGMPKIKELYSLNGSMINLQYLLPNGKYVKFLNDNDTYLGNQVECEFNDEVKKYFGIVANNSFLLVCEYEENCNNPEIVVYKRR